MPKPNLTLIYDYNKYIIPGLIIESEEENPSKISSTTKAKTEFT